MSLSRLFKQICLKYFREEKSMRLKELREERNLTQNDVAKAINTSQRNISRWEKNENEPTSNFVLMLADFFECSTDYLLGREDDFGNITIKKEKSPTDNLSAEEKELLENFRQLNFKNKMHVSSYAKIRLEEQEESTNKRKA